MNPLAIMWYLITFAIAIGYSIVFCPTVIPGFVRKLVVYGKSADDEKVVRGKAQPPNDESYVLQRLQLPKRYFSHFYIFASSYAIVVTSILLTSYYHHKAPREVIRFLDVVAGGSRVTDVNAVATIVALILYLAHVIRRAYESLYVSTYSNTGRINIIHYTMAFVFYFGVITSLLAEAPGFTSEGFQHKSFQQAYNWKWYQVVGTAIYFWAVWHQHKCAAILANLRKDNKGQVLHQHHKIPYGDWFSFVSNPHYLAEILIYLSFNVILEFQNTLVILALMFTMTNQILAALITHDWYLTTFSADYPRQRKAIIPLIL